MELKIEIDETKFKDIIEKELNAFSQEELHDLLKQMIIEYMKNHQEEVMNLFIRKKIQDIMDMMNGLQAHFLKKHQTV